MKIYIVMENYENDYSHPVMATDDKDQALMVMRYRKNPEADTIWIEETTLKEEKHFLFKWQAKRYIKRSPYIFYSWKESK